MLLPLAATCVPACGCERGIGYRSDPKAIPSDQSLQRMRTFPQMKILLSAIAQAQKTAKSSKPTEPLPLAHVLQEVPQPEEFQQQILVLAGPVAAFQGRQVFPFYFFQSIADK